MTDSSPQLTEEQQKELEEKLKNMSPEKLQELQKQQCIFCKILSGEIPSKKVYEDDICVAVLDVNPASKGHLLLIPKEHYTVMPQLPNTILGHLFSAAKDLSKVLLKTMKVSGTNVFITNGPAAGQRAQHFLIHLIPRKEGDKVLQLDEKLIDKEMQQKVKVAVESKLLGLLGKKIVPKEETKKLEEGKREQKEKVQKKEQEENDGDEDPKQRENEKEELTSQEEKEANLDEIASLFK